MSPSRPTPQSRRRGREQDARDNANTGVINVIQTKRKDAAEVTQTIIAHEADKKIDFIGSAVIGKQIGQVCAKQLEPVLMELGGEGPAIVLEDADLQKAALLCARSAITDHGQLRFSIERIIVHKTVHEKFVDVLRPTFVKLPVAGDAVFKRFAQHAYDVLTNAQEAGAELLVNEPGVSERY
ncbi:hypothetical protein N0V86_006563 [Didymella sp. IMI 355093]|nr:hypothetical protein N0V86_006563 [Didymella sp. IMI 355093]